MDPFPRARIWLPLVALALMLGAATGQAQESRTLSVHPADPPASDAFVIKLHDYVPSGASWVETGFTISGNVIEIDHVCDVTNLPTLSYFDDEKPFTGMSLAGYEVRWTVEYVYAGESQFRTLVLTFPMPVTEPVEVPIPGLHPIGWLALMALLAGVFAFYRGKTTPPRPTRAHHA